MNLLTKFRLLTINVASRVKNAPPHGSHVFQANVTIFELIEDIIETNLLTKCHEYWTINVASRVLTRQMLRSHNGRRTTDKRRSQKLTMSTLKNSPPTGGHVFQATGTIFELVPNIIGTKLLTKFHDDHIIGTNHLTKFHDNRTIHVASRVLTRKNSPPPDGIRTNLLTKFHEDRKINVEGQMPRPLEAMFFQPIGIIFKLVQDIIGMNLLTKFHEDRTINVASRVLTRFYYSNKGKNAPPLGNHVFQTNVTIFELIQDIITTNLLTKLHEDWTITVASRVKNAPPLGSHVFQESVTIFKLIQDIIHTNHLTKFHEDLTTNVASRVLTRKTAPPPGGHFHDDWEKIVTSRPYMKYCPLHEDWASNVTSTVFELSRGINGTNVLTKFHEDQTINVASRVFIRQNVDDERRTTDKS
ncbi:hypothetical protein DPMN_135775 [Dreissena polymorpha]|uniref:Uncharacterized protein n=1 Tax=Dreissena polymorpha TaxID=45954 RepID=A0A9D4G1K3_DREPO|nr:hypothetical protein DPMN_135775 [Dreissena polymorpha]